MLTHSCSIFRELQLIRYSSRVFCLLVDRQVFPAYVILVHIAAIFNIWIRKTGQVRVVFFNKSNQEPVCLKPSTINIIVIAPANG